MKYRHFKGGIYELVCEAKLESNPQIIMIIYRADDGSSWVRPRDVFFELIEHEGKIMRRFEPIN
jgi:hypothetical protein